MNKDKQRLILLIIGITLVLIGISNQSEDKKEATLTTKTFTYGGLGLALMSIFGKGGFLTTLGPVGWIIIGLSSLLVFAPGIITNWANLFHPQPSIPIWVWIGAGFILLMVVMKKK